MKQGNYEQQGDKLLAAGEEIAADEFEILLNVNKDYADGAAPLSTNDALVILDTEITDELSAEGIARDFVRMVQQERKDLDLDVSDNISVKVAADEKTTTALQANEAYIKEQVLAENISYDSGSFKVACELDGADVSFEVEKLSKAAA